MSWAARHHSVLVLFSVSDSATNAPMMRDDFTHEVWADAAPRRRVRIAGPLYGDDNVPLLRVEFEGGDAECRRVKYGCSIRFSSTQLLPPVVRSWCPVDGRCGAGGE